MKILKKTLLKYEDYRKAYCVTVDHPQHEVAIVGKSGKAYRCGQTINFGLIYEMYYKSLAKKLGISDREAEIYVDNYFKTYKGVKKWQNKERTRAHKFKRTRTLLGRSRSLPEVDNPDRWIREKAEREGINHPVQGTAAELIKCAMIDCMKHKGLKKLNTHMIAQVHDELMFRCPLKNIDKAIPIIKSLMENAFKNRDIDFSVPIVAEGGSGHDWTEAK